MVALEDLRVSNMTRSARGTFEEPGRHVRQKAELNRSILNVGWFGFERMLAYKLGESGGVLVKVPPAFTSQTCSVCGHVDAGNRKSQAIFSCTACGADGNADVNAAKTILARALGPDPDRRGSTPSLDVEGKAQAPCEASTRSLGERLDAVA